MKNRNMRIKSPLIATFRNHLMYHCVGQISVFYSSGEPNWAILNSWDIAILWTLVIWSHFGKISISRTCEIFLLKFEFKHHQYTLNFKIKQKNRIKNSNLGQKMKYLSKSVIFGYIVLVLSKKVKKSRFRKKSYGFLFFRCPSLISMTNLKNHIRTLFLSWDLVQFLSLGWRSLPPLSWNSGYVYDGTLMIFL